MSDERSILAVNFAEEYGRGNATKKDLLIAAAAASDAAAAYTSYAAYAAYAAAAAYYAGDVYYKANQLQTADICRQILTKEVFEKINLVN